MMLQIAISNGKGGTGKTSKLIKNIWKKLMIEVKGIF